MNKPHESPNESENMRIIKLLTQGTEQFDARILSSLREARMVALQRQRTHHEVFSLSTIGHHAHMPRSANQWLATVFVLATLIFGIAYYWQNMPEHQNTQNLDLQILTDDLPIDVFVDK